jgi:hypothetical protein
VKIITHLHLVPRSRRVQRTQQETRYYEVFFYVVRAMPIARQRVAKRISHNNRGTAGDGDFCSVLLEVTKGEHVRKLSPVQNDTCGGGVEYLHRSPASPKR